jgi:hypothetical protein
VTTNGSNTMGTEGPLVLVGAQSGITLIPSPTPLTRLNYFDGKFLRADDLSREQGYLRRLVELGNQAGGSGVVHGFDLLAAGAGTLTLTAGLAIDPRGRVLYLPHEGALNLAQLIERSAQSSSSAGTQAGGAPGFAECEAAAAGGEVIAGTQATDLYVITLAHAEALCGEEDVYGKLCEDACVGSTQRPYRLEGVVVRAVPLTLPAAPCTASWLGPQHRRSQVASAWFAGERAALGHDLSAQRIRGEVWCRGAVAETGDAVPVAVVSVSGGALQFVDPWIARRERFAPVPPRWWQWQTQMRPLAVFWAQILQFQCHLADLLADGPDTGGTDPCADQNALLQEVKALLQQIQQSGGQLPPAVTEALGGLGDKVGAVLTGSVGQSSRILVDLGITELPPAGYLPVDPSSPLDVNEQVKRLMGEGVELRFCAVRPDYVAHALEEAQHLDRICLLTGLDDPTRRQRVDILVPDGQVVQGPAAGGGLPLEVRVRISPPDLDTDRPADVAPELALVINGAGRAEMLPGGGGAFHFAGRGIRIDFPSDPPANQVDAAGQQGTPATTSAALARTRFTRGTRKGMETAVAQDGATAQADGRGGVTGFQTAPPQPVQTAAPTAPPGLPPSAWASMSIGRNPFALQVGEAVAVNGEFALNTVEFDDHTESERDVAYALVLQGDLEVEQAAGGVSLQGTALGHAVLRTGDGSPESNGIQAGVKLTLQGTAAQGQLTVELSLEGELQATLSTGWSGPPVLATSDLRADWIEMYRLRLRDEGDTEADEKAGALEEEHPDFRSLPVGLVTASQNAATTQPGNAYHDASVQALTTLEVLLREPGFRAQREAILFPPPAPAASGESRVRATRDWVLFHRRRETSCCCTPPAPAPVAAQAAVARRYRVYHIRAPRGTSIEQIRAAVGGPAPVEGTEELTITPEFQGNGSLTLATPAAYVAGAWNTVDKGARIVYGAVGGAGAGQADGAAVHEGRLNRIAGIVDDATPDEGALYEVLSAVPAHLSASGADGVMVLVTLEEAPQTTRLRVFAARGAGTMVKYLTMLQNGELALALGSGKNLGEVVYNGTSTTPLDSTRQAVQTAWKAAFPNNSVGRAVLVLPSAAPVGGDAVAQQRAQAVLTPMGGTLTDGIKRTGEDVMGGSAGLLIVEPGQTIPG